MMASGVKCTMMETFFLLCLIFLALELLLKAFFVYSISVNVKQGSCFLKVLTFIFNYSTKFSLLIILSAPLATLSED